MDLSIYLAQAFSLYFIIIGLAMITRKKRFEKVVDELVASPASLFIIAVITLILGILLVLSHNIWANDWRVIITILAWVTLLSGIIRTFFPAYIVKMAKNIHNKSFYYIVVAIILFVGAYLGYLGFV